MRIGGENDRFAFRLPLHDEFLLVLVKLRLNSPDFLLADMFGISRPHCGRILQSWIPFLAEKFGEFVFWIPMNRRNPLPVRFGKYSKCLAIMDCFEIYTEKPSDMADAQSSWSDYKHNDTMKVLIAVTVSGTILHISEPWGGRVSDVKIVRKDNVLLSHLKADEAGTFVLADKGFRGLTAFLPLKTDKMLVMPKSAIGGGQLTWKDHNENREKSNVRINVERVIGQLRCFKILQHDFPMSRLYQLRDILKICAGIVNLRPPLCK